MLKNLGSVFSEKKSGEFRFIRGKVAGNQFHQIFSLSLVYLIDLNLRFVALCQKKKKKKVFFFAILRSLLFVSEAFFDFLASYLGLCADKDVSTDVLDFLFLSVSHLFS